METIKWRIDPAHSEIMFKVKHLMITTVTGYFRKYELVLESDDEDFTSVKTVEFNADIDSIDTNNTQRDTHLKSADFFDSEKHKQLHFAGKNYKLESEDVAVLEGDLTIRGVTKPVKLRIEFNGVVVDPYGQTKAGFSVSGKISRKEFGLTWNTMTEAGHVVVADEIKILADVQLVKQEELVEA